MEVGLKIIGLLARNTEEKFTINEIARTLNEYYSFVHRTVNKLTEEGVLIKNKVGRAYVCSLNLEDEKTLVLIQLSEIKKKDEFYSKNKELKLILEDFVKSARLQSKAISIVLFGSRAKGSEAKESDIDILLICNKKIEIDKTAKEIYAKYGKEINTIVMTPADFKKQKERAIIKEIIHSHYVLCGAENFVNLLFRK